MRKLICFLTILITLGNSYSLLAQGPTADDAIKSYSSRKKKKGNSEEDSVRFSNEYLVIGYNIDRLSGTPSDMNLTWRSGGVSIALFLNQPLGKKSGFSISEGIGISSRNYYQNYSQFGSKNTTAAAWSSREMDTAISLNKFVVTTLDVPIELRYKCSLNSKYDLKLATGVTFNLNLDIMKKTTYEDGMTIKLKGTPDLKNVNTFRAGFHARASINRISLTYYQSLNNLFSSPSIQVTPFSFGVALNL